MTDRRELILVRLLDIARGIDNRRIICDSHLNWLKISIHNKVAFWSNKKEIVVYLECAISRIYKFISNLNHKISLAFDCNMIWIACVFQRTVSDVSDN